MRKLSTIRSNEFQGCPFGLDIPTACKTAGDLVTKMQMVDEENPDNAVSNKSIYDKRKVDQECKFADQILNKFSKTNCSYGDTAAGEKVSSIPAASSDYPSISKGFGNSPGMYDTNGFYFSPEIFMNAPFGMFSIFAQEANKQNLIKYATTNKSSNIKEKLYELELEYFPILQTAFRNSKVKLLSEEEIGNLYHLIKDF